MKIFVYLFFSLFLSCLSFADQGITEDQILIGMHTDLSGPASMIGKQSVDGVNMRIDEFNQAGGVHGIPGGGEGPLLRLALQRQVPPRAPPRRRAALRRRRAHVAEPLQSMQQSRAPALPRGCGAALEVSLNGQQYEPLGTGGVAYTAVSDCGRGAHAAALVPPRALA